MLTKHNKKDILYCRNNSRFTDYSDRRNRGGLRRLALTETRSVLQDKFNENRGGIIQ